MAGGFGGMVLLDTAHRAEWRAWLARHYKSEKEIWLVYYKKHTGKVRISYNDAVEEALCFGWIDSTVRRIDADRYAQRFSPRNSKSPYSQSNRERFARLSAQGKVMKGVAGPAKNVTAAEFKIPTDIINALKADKETWKNFRKFSKAYVRIRLSYIEGARRRPKEFEKRLRNFVAMTKKNRLFGFGGIQKYY
jgi:uncharacterized protein YdeI (YjbR/CyaY-like superfamily)